MVRQKGAGQHQHPFSPALRRMPSRSLSRVEISSAICCGLHHGALIVRPPGGARQALLNIAGVLQAHPSSPTDATCKTAPEYPLRLDARTPHRYPRAMLQTYAFGPEATPKHPVADRTRVAHLRNWNVIAKRMSANRPVISVDMRNHGDSPAPHSRAMKTWRQTSAR